MLPYRAQVGLNIEANVDKKESRSWRTARARSIATIPLQARDDPTPASAPHHLPQNRLKMCLERLTQLKCGHFELEPHCADICEEKGVDVCEKYKAVVMRVDKSRSCAQCKLARGALMGFASPGLTKLRRV